MLNFDAHAANEKARTQRKTGPSLWWLTAPLLIWSAHFLLIYIITALVCAGRLSFSETMLDGVNFGLTAVAGIALIGVLIRSVITARGESEGGKAVHRAIAICALISLVALLWVAVPHFFLSYCA